MLAEIWRDFASKTREFFDKINSVDVIIMSARGGEGGVPRRREGEGGVEFFFESPRRGGSPERGTGRGAGRVPAANWGIWGEG